MVDKATAKKTTKKTDGKKTATKSGGKRRALTSKQKKLVQGIVEGKTQKQSAIDAGYSEKCASEIASQQLNKDSVKATLADLMEHMGLSDGALLVKHRELLNAQKQISGVRDADGGSVDFIEVPDHAVQSKALEMAYKLKGAFVEKREITGANGESLALKIVFGAD